MLFISENCRKLFQVKNSQYNNHSLAAKIKQQIEINKADDLDPDHYYADLI